MPGTDVAERDRGPRPTSTEAVEPLAEERCPGEAEAAVRQDAEVAADNLDSVWLGLKVASRVQTYHKIVSNVSKILNCLTHLKKKKTFPCFNFFSFCFPVF